MRLKRILFAAALAALLCGIAAPPSARAEVSVSVSFFHQQLAPHGRWVVAGSYGDVWVPGGVQTGWAPYVDGQWIYTEYGWTWVSDDPWGDIAYHYGTWSWVDAYGWVWLPGTVWAPAWVTWAYTDDYIGWAPVPPSFAFSVSGYVGSPIVVAAPRYVFVPSRQFVGVRVSNVRVSPQENATIFRRAAKATSFPVSNGVVRTAGLPTERVERALGRRVERVSIERARTQPTAFARGGFEHGKSIAVVAPERERRNASKSEVRTERGAAAKAHADNRHEGRAAPAPKSTELQRKSSGHDVQSRQAERKQPAPKPKADRSNPAPKSAEIQRKSSGHDVQSRQVERRQTAPKPRADRPNPAPKSAQVERKSSGHDVQSRQVERRQTAPKPRADRPNPAPKSAQVERRPPERKPEVERRAEARPAAPKPNPVAHPETRSAANEKPQPKARPESKRPESQKSEKD